MCITAVRKLFRSALRTFKLGAGEKPAMPTCIWLVGEDPVHGSKKVTCVGLDVWLVGNTVCPFCQKHIEWRKDAAAS